MFKSSKQRAAFFAAMKAKKEGVIAPKVKALDLTLPTKEETKEIMDDPLKSKIGKPLTFSKLKSLMKIKKF